MKTDSKILRQALKYAYQYKRIVEEDGAEPDERVWSLLSTLYRTLGNGKRRKCSPLKRWGIESKSDHRNPSYSGEVAYANIMLGNKEKRILLGVR